MADDTTKSVKIKLSLNNLVPKQNEKPETSDPLPEIEKVATELKLKPMPNVNPPQPIEIAQKNIEPIIRTEERPKISIKKTILQDVKPQIAPSNDEPPKTGSAIPAYAKSNVPDQNESSATSTTLKITEDIKGKTIKILDPQPERKPIIDLNALNIKLDQEPPKKEQPSAKEPPQALESENMPNIDFELHNTGKKRNISDTVKLQIKQQPPPNSKIFSNIIKETTTQEPPSIMPNASHEAAKSRDNFTIPKNVLPNIPNSAKSTKKKPNYIILGISGVILLLIIYFMITTIRTLST